MNYKITQSGCHEWLGRISSSGYGEARLLGQYVGAHRLSYLLNRGALGPEEMVLHSCDNRKCVNPDHLFRGDAKANAEDMVRKGRNKPGPATLPGEDHATAKLAENQVKAIKQSKAKGTALAAMYGVSVSTISKIKNGRLWKHL